MGFPGGQGEGLGWDLTWGLQRIWALASELSSSINGMCGCENTRAAEAAV